VSRSARWRPPVAICSLCERERPCHYARTPAPVCESCRRGRLAPRERCAGCGESKRVVARTPRGPECSACRTRRLKSTVDCQRCDQRARPSVADPRVCERCAGEPVRQVCRGCGAEEQNYADGRCARCVLAERLQALAAAGDPSAVERLTPYLAAVRDGAKPWSVLSWMTLSAGYRTLEELTRGELELSHEDFDTVRRGQSTRYLRAALVRAGVLPVRDEQAAKLDAFIRAQVAHLSDGEDRARLRAFAVWQIQHDLKRRERRGETTRSSERLARAQISVAVELITWLHAHGMTLRELRQEHLDRWIADGSTYRRRVRAFLAWARRGGLLPALEAPRAEPRGHADPLDPDLRLRLVGTLLADDTLDLRDRVAGCLLLIFAQPITRLARLNVDDVDDHGRPVRLQLGPEPLDLPEPLGALVAELKHRRPGLATTGAGEPGRWLFPGLRLDAPLHPEHMRRRLRRLGIIARPGRAAALMHLAQTLPPAILADLLGISESRAAGWTRAATGDWARYAAQAKR
jgi:protein-disulfide isomerase-like protein with CxxC motif